MDLTSTNTNLWTVSHNLYHQRDRRSFISRLPNEILESIFLLLAAECFWTDRADWESFPYPWLLTLDDMGLDPHVAELVHISHVSTHWRSVALNCPILWSEIFVASPQWTQISLARSGEVPLKIQIDLQTQRISDSDLLAITESLLSHAERIQELRFRICSWDTVTSQAFTRLFVAAPKLRILDLSFGTIPRVRPVFDRDVQAPWDVYKLGGLTTLSLRSVPPLFQQSVVEFRAVLKCMPGLVNLDLENALPEARDFISSPEFGALEKIDLPLLSRLSIVAPLSSVVAFLSCVNIPACKRLQIECRYDSPDTDYSRLFPVLAELYKKDRALFLPTIHSVVMATEFPNAVLIFSTSSECNFYPRSRTVSSFNWDSDVVLDLSFRLPLEQHYTTVVNDICALMPVTKVSALQICSPLSCNTDTAHAFWRNTLRYLPALRRILFSSVCMDEGFASTFPFHLASENVENRNEDELLAPALEEIEFDHATFPDFVDPSDQPQMGESDLELVPPFPDLQPLLTALSSRKVSRPRLILTKCTTEEEFDIEYDMVAEWDSDQCFRVVKSRKICYGLFGQELVQ